MKDDEKSREQLIQELGEARSRIAQLEGGGPVERTELPAAVADGANLVNGKYSIRDLIDLENLRSIFEDFSKASPARGKGHTSIADSTIHPPSH